MIIYTSNNFSNDLATSPRKHNCVLGYYLPMYWKKLLSIDKSGPSGSIYLKYAYFGFYIS